MRHIVTLIAAATLAVSSSSVLAATEAEHAGHHPAEKTAAVETTKYDQNMGRMMEMHQKMQAAKTPEERTSLMKEHMASMQGGMAMMDQMKGGMSMPGAKKSSGKGDMPMSHQSMQRRMDMMEMMMQMMMDREPVAAPVK
jgi:predicted membrane-bound mannosyltransferase